MANCACVVRELELGVLVVRGWEVRKAREDGVEFVAGIWLLVGGDKRDFKDASREAFCASVDRSA